MIDKYELLQDLAMDIIRKGITKVNLEEEWVIRKGKTFKDVTIQVHKGMKKGRGKLEHEVAEVAFALDRVIYRRRGKHVPENSSKDKA